MVTKRVHRPELVVAILSAVLMAGCSQESADNANDNANRPDTAPKSTTQNKSGSSDKTPANQDSGSAAKQDSGPASPIAAAEFPRPKNAEKPMYTSDTNAILFHQEGTVDDQVLFYTEQLEKIGWKKDPSSEVSDGMAFLDFTKGSLSFTVTINPLREGKITTIAQGNGLSVPKSLEQEEDDADDGVADDGGDGG